MILSISIKAQKMVTIQKAIECAGYCICIVIYIVEIQDSRYAKSTLFKIGSILRFLPLLAMSLMQYTPKKKVKKFTVMPFKTNSERLIGVLRELREMDFIKNDPDIDSHLE